MKPRSDSKLKTLPEDRQEQIIEWIRTPKSESSPGGLQHAREQLAADGLRVSLRALSEFWSWWQLRERFTAADARTAQIVDLLKERSPDMSPDRIREFGQAVFELEAIAEKDSEAYVSLQSLRLARESAETKGRQKEEELALKKAKFARDTCSLFLKWFKDEKAREIADSNLSNAQKIAALRKTFFADVDALEKSGEVTLPE